MVIRQAASSVLRQEGQAKAIEPAVGKAGIGLAAQGKEPRRQVKRRLF